MEAEIQIITKSAVKFEYSLKELEGEPSTVVQCRVIILCDDGSQYLSHEYELCLSFTCYGKV